MLGVKAIRNHPLSPFGEKNMGGKKKLTLRQMEKMQSRKDVRKERRSGGSPAAEKKIFLPNHRDQKVIRELEKMKVLTPYTVASRFDLRLSVAKDFLETYFKHF